MDYLGYTNYISENIEGKLYVNGDKSLPNLGDFISH